MRAEEFIEWVRGASVLTGTGAPDDQLEALVTDLGGVSILALTEAAHGAVEILEFRNRLFRFLVEKHGFASIALESGMAESNLVQAYVDGADLHIDYVLARGFSWGFGAIPQNRALIEWIRSYNIATRANGLHPPIRFYGFDLSGSVGRGDVEVGTNVALASVLAFLERWDPDASKHFALSLRAAEAWLLRPGLKSAPYQGYEQLDAEQRELLSGTIAAIAARLAEKEAKYFALAGETEVALATQGIEAAVQVDRYLRQLPLGAKSFSKCADGRWPIEVASARDVRDQAMADNIDTIAARERDRGQLFLFGSRYHLGRSPVRANVYDAAGCEIRQRVAGAILAEKFGGQLLTIGNFIGSGTVRCCGLELAFDCAPRDAFESVLDTVGHAQFALDLRTVPTRFRRWLGQQHRLENGNQRTSCSIGESFDLLLYLGNVSPAEDA